MFDSANTTMVTTWLRTVPSAAVTRTVKVLLPATKPVRPVMAMLASLSAAVATAATEVVPLSTETVEPLVTAVPFKVKVARLVLFDRA